MAQESLIKFTSHPPKSETTMMKTQKLCEVGIEQAQAFFDAGGTIHIHPQGSSMLSGHTMTKSDFRSVEHGLAEFRSQVGGKPVLLIDAEDTHPANPLVAK